MIATLSWIDLLIIVMTSLSIVALTSRFPTSAEGQLATRTVPMQKGCHSFDFDFDGMLICGNNDALQFLKEMDAPTADWLWLRSELLPRFSTLPARITPAKSPSMTIHTPSSVADQMECVLERHSTGFSLLLRPRSKQTVARPAEIHKTLRALDNVELLKAATVHAPFPIWQTHEDGTTGWSNACYQQLDATIERTSLNTHANASLFDLPVGLKPGDAAHRLSIKDQGRNRTYWFDVSQLAFGQTKINFAIDVRATVNAETAQRNSVQTLAKTFAHLATGLVIFDRERQLVLFNPALIDLTALQPEFLASRPNLFSFFDQLRDKQIMPEPKDYSNWRERVADVVSAASDDNFNETWHLHTGLTYRVTGRPHPDGAIAFLFEDISAEIALTRKFRAESAMTQSALDAMDEPLAIFDQTGVLVHFNIAMRAQLGINADKDLIDRSVREISHLWRERYKPSPIWGEIRDFICGAEERTAWTASVMRKTGGTAKVQVTPLTAGATMVRILAKAETEQRQPSAEVAA